MYHTLDEGCPTCGAPPNMVCSGINPCPDRIARAQQRFKERTRQPRVDSEGRADAPARIETPPTYEDRESQAAYDDFWRL